jgi:predicted site-specific integrase-resolvase
MRTLSTAEATEKIGVHRVNLQKAIKEGRIKAPPVVSVGGVKVRLWSSDDVERASKALGKRKKGKADRKRVTA